MNKRKHHLAIVVTLWFCFITPTSLASNKVFNDESSTQHLSSQSSNNSPFKLVGQGTMRWLWIDIYLAKLFTPTGKYQPQQWPLSLELIYARNISREDLIQTTADEWQRQAINYQEKWLTQLTQIWPDISPNDKLLLNIDKNGGSDFYYNDQYIGSLGDEAFARAFVAIWLSDNTLKPSLRQQLTGIRP